MYVLSRHGGARPSRPIARLGEPLHRLENLDVAIEMACEVPGSPGRPDHDRKVRDAKRLFGGDVPVHHALSELALVRLVQGPRYGAPSPTTHCPHGERRHRVAIGVQGPVEHPCVGVIDSQRAHRRVLRGWWHRRLGGDVSRRRLGLCLLRLLLRLHRVRWLFRHRRVLRGWWHRRLGGDVTRRRLGLRLLRLLLRLHRVRWLFRHRCVLRGWRRRLGRRPPGLVLRLHDARRHFRRRIRTRTARRR